MVYERNQRTGVLCVIVCRECTGEGARLLANSGISIKDAEIGDSVQTSELKTRVGEVLKCAHD